MTLRRDRLPAILSGLSVASAALLYGVASGLPAVGAAVALIAVITAVPRGRLPSPGTAQVLLAVAAVAIAWVVAATVTPPITREAIRLSAIPGGVALAALLLALPRLLMARPRGGAAATAAITVASVTISGLGDIGPLYLALILIHLALTGAAIGSSDRGRPPYRQWPRRRWGMAGAGLVVCGIAGAGAATALPPLYDEALRLGGIIPRSPVTGFSTTLRLGSLSGMAESDEPVLRIEGPAPDHLRGVVFTTYDNGRWRAPTRNRPRHLEASPPSTPGATTALRSAGRDERRFFLPLGARNIAVPGGAALIDSMGIVFPAHGEAADEVHVVLGEGRGLDISPPTAEDLDVPTKLQGGLAAIAEEWTRDANTTETRLDAMLRRFSRDFEYSQVFQRPRGRDPVLSFLEQSRRGHCEYFASAMALLTRSLGVPARVVGGFRVFERNPLGGYHVVRQRDAHAWVEVWVQGRGWITVDPTPADALDAAVSRRTPWHRAITDLLAARFSRGLRWLERRTPLELLSAAATLLLGWLVWRAVAAIRGRRRRDNRQVSAGEYEGPLPELEPLLDALAREGVVRRRSEPLESLAKRVGGEPTLGTRGATAGALLRRYTEWRFGDRGDEGTLARDLSEWARKSAGRG